MHKVIESFFRRFNFLHIPLQHFPAFDFNIIVLSVSR